MDPKQLKKLLSEYWWLGHVRNTWSSHAIRRGEVHTASGNINAIVGDWWHHLTPWNGEGDPHPQEHVYGRPASRELWVHFTTDGGVGGRYGKERIQRAPDLSTCGNVQGLPQEYRYLLLACYISGIYGVGDCSVVEHLLLFTHHESGYREFTIYRAPRGYWCFNDFFLGREPAKKFFREMQRALGMT